MARNNRKVEDIDEAAILQSIYERDNPPAAAPKAQEKVAEPVSVQPEKPKEAKEPVRRKRGSNADYGSLFLGRNELKARSCVYISQRIHTAISEIVRVIADRDITVGGYIDSILSEHLETHKEEISELYDRKLSKKNSNSLMDLIR